MRSHVVFRYSPVSTAVLALALGILFIAAIPLGASGSRETTEAITLYSGRGESLVDPLVRRFTAETGITVNVRYAGTSELAVLLQEEGERSPADLYWAQDAGALGTVSRRGLFQRLPDEILRDIPSIYRNDTGEWIATSGRARVLAYHPDLIPPDELPGSVFDLTRPEYAGRIAWAPTNGSFQAFVSAMRVVHGDEVTLEWLRDMSANDVQAYRNNTSIVEALGAEEIAMGITNNYYLLRFLADDSAYPVRQRFFRDGDIGNLVNVAGAGILKTAPNPRGAERFLRFLLDTEAQQFFTRDVYEYPIIDGIEPNAQLESFQRLLEVSPNLDLDALEDLEGTLSLLRRAGVL